METMQLLEYGKTIETPKAEGHYYLKDEDRQAFYQASSSYISSKFLCIIFFYIYWAGFPKCLRKILSIMGICDYRIVSHTVGYCRFILIRVMNVPVLYNKRD